MCDDRFDSPGCMGVYFSYTVKCSDFAMGEFFRVISQLVGCNWGLSSDGKLLNISEFCWCIENSQEALLKKEFYEVLSHRLVLSYQNGLE